MNSNLPKRKTLRLKKYDYSQSGYYFITICAQDRQNLFGSIIDNVGQGCVKCCQSPLGGIVNEQWYELANRYASIRLDKFTVMPNHVHGIIVLNNAQHEYIQRQEQSPCPTVSLFDILCAYKSITTKLCNQLDGVSGRPIWQYRYHDHVIRDEHEYQMIWEYIDTNPLKWKLDRYYKE